jgi:YqaJ-like viral recombinase domain
VPKSKNLELENQLVIHSFEQGSDEWFKARLGIPTASNFGIIMADGREGSPSITRAAYLNRLAGEIITGVPAEETFKSKAMERGNEMEPAAIADYEWRRDTKVTRIGFATNFSGLKLCGASPDGLIDFDGGLETKTMRPALMIPLLLRGATMPPEHRAQVQGNMLVLERAWWDFKIFYPGMPDFTVRVARDDAYIRELQGQIERFNFDLKQLVKQLRSMGAK